MAKWYAVLTKSRKEWLAEKNLKYQGYSTFFPHIKYWTTPKKTKPREIQRAYLPRYMFVGFTGKPHESVYNVNNTIAVSTVVYFGGTALEIHPEIMAELSSRADENGEIYLGEKPKPQFLGNSGDKVKFGEASPLFGLVAELQRVDSCGRLMVKVDQMLGAAREITVSAQDVSEIIKPGGGCLRPFEPISA